MEVCSLYSFRSKCRRNCHVWANEPLADTLLLMLLFILSRVRRVGCLSGAEGCVSHVMPQLGRGWKRRGEEGEGRRTDKG